MNVSFIAPLVSVLRTSAFRAADRGRKFVVIDFYALVLGLKISFDRMPRFLNNIQIAS